ncbi:MAG: RagB/SusD family nutrient uptake outer membrane protein [Bacteroidales bacterium]|nr:RagB/SusD family nutrient uptake outer membrane protein [Bacteroidales bacterium]
MKNTFYLIGLVLLWFCPACQDMDIMPPNIVTDEAIYNEGGIEAYMAGLYSKLPMEDFNRTKGGNYDGFFSWNSGVWDQVSTGETGNRSNTGIYHVTDGYWKEGYQIIRNANHLIKNLPAYVDQMEKADEWIAEAKFIRAYTYFHLVKCYGGVPIIEEPQTLEGDESSLWVARSSHQECFDFILRDLDDAITSMPTKSVKGRANKYVAAAFKSRVALFAGSYARYGQTYNYVVNDVLLCGLPAESANGYFQQAWDAAKLVGEGEYELYQGNSDKAENFAEVFEKADVSKESIFIRQYDFLNYVHSFDAIYCPPRMTTTYGDRYNPTADWVELFDGLPIDPATGKLTPTDASGNYLVFDGADGLFRNAEPRLKGSILLPGHTYKGVELDIRRGIIKENIDPSTPIQKFVKDDYFSTSAYGGWFNANVVSTTENVNTQTPYVTSSGLKLNKIGMDGPKLSTNNTITGLHGRKWLSMSLSVAETKLHSSFQTWIDIRYAEVLLNRAEAALELAQNGVNTYQGVDMQTDAFEMMNMVRSRAGATLLSSPADLSTVEANIRGGGPGGFVQAPNRGLQLIRVERYKELAFEHKIYWDLIRWFTFDTQINSYRRRMINPFLFAKGATVNPAGNPDGQYIYDVRVSEKGNNSLTFQTKYYYQAIPGAELKVNPLLVQNNQH